MSIFKKLAMGISIIGLTWAFSVSAVVLQGNGGGTGISTSTPSNDNFCLVEASSTPFLTWKLVTCGGGSATTTINQVQGPTFTFSINSTTSPSSITTTTTQIFLNLLAYSSGTDINVSPSGVINFVNTPGFITAAPATSTYIAQGTATGPALTLATSGPLMSIACSAGTCTFTSIPTSTILAGYVTSTGVTFINNLTGSIIATGTVNQISISSSTGQLVLSLPQNINTSANVQFNGLGLGSTIGGGDIITLSTGFGNSLNSGGVDIKGTGNNQSGNDIIAIRVTPTYSLASSNLSSTGLFGIYFSTSTATNNGTGTFITAQFECRGPITATSSLGNFCIHVASGTSWFQGQVIASTSLQLPFLKNVILATDNSGNVVSTTTSSGVGSATTTYSYPIIYVGNNASLASSTASGTLLIGSGNGLWSVALPTSTSGLTWTYGSGTLSLAYSSSGLNLGTAATQAIAAFLSSTTPFVTTVNSTSGAISIIGDGATVTSTVVGGVTTFSAINSLPSDNSYFFTHIASDLASTLVASDTPDATFSSTTVATLSNGTTSIQKWSTIIGSPNATFIQPGLIDVHIDAAQTGGTKPTFLYGVVNEISATGTFIGQIASTTNSALLTGTTQDFDLDAVLAEPYTLQSSSSRVQANVIASVSGALLAPTVQLYYGGTSGDSRLEIPGPDIDSQNFVPYTGATKALNLGANNLSTTGVFNAGSSTVTGTASAANINATTSATFPGIVSSTESNALILAAANGNYGSYTGSFCGGGSAVNGISASGTVTGCFTPSGGSTATSSIYWQVWKQGATRVSNTQVSVTDASDASSSDSLLSKGTILKWLEAGATRFAMVMSSTYVSGSSSLFTIGDTFTTSFSNTSSLAYAIQKTNITTLGFAGTIGATSTDAMGRYYLPLDVKIFGMDCFLGTAGTTSSPQFQLDVSAVSSTATCTLGTGATSSVGNTYSANSTASSSKYLNIEITSSTNATDIDAYINVFSFPLQNQFLP